MKPIFQKRRIHSGPTIFSKSTQTNKKGGMMKAILIKFFKSILRKAICSLGVAGLTWLEATGHLSSVEYGSALEAIKNLSAGEWAVGLSSLGLILLSVFWTFAKEWLQDRKENA